MNARELHDDMARFSQSGGISFDHGSDELSLVVRALDMLAATEDSTDEIVRELRGQHCRDFGSDPQCDADGLCICAMHERAAAALVAERAAKEKAEAERDELKRHAEAMAEELQWIACRYDDSKSTRECAADAYEMKSAAAQALHAYRATQEKS